MVIYPINILVHILEKAEVEEILINQILLLDNCQNLCSTNERGLTHTFSHSSTAYIITFPKKSKRMSFLYPPKYSSNFICAFW